MRLCALVLILASCGFAQYANYPWPGIPRTKDGKPDLTAPAPKTADGKPDLSGVWHSEPTPEDEQKRLARDPGGPTSVPGMEPFTVSRYGGNILRDYKPGEVAMTPEAEAVFNRRRSGAEALPATYCLPLGVPLATLVSEVHKIVQTPRLMIVMLETDGLSRQIYLDGRKLPEDPWPSWLGYSVGRWENDTLVVETIGFNDRTWLDAMGHPRSEAMHLTERFRRRDFGHLDVEMTFNDPKTYTKPFTVKVTHLLQADTDILEYVCTENEKDRAHMGLK